MEVNIKMNKRTKISINISIIIIIFSLVFISLFSGQIHAEIYQRGDTGKNVEELQKMLDQIGYDVNVDGNFGPWTERAVKDFQFNNNLKVDGKAGNRTFEELQNKQGEIEYTVKSGDNLGSLAAKYNTSIQEIKERNNLNGDLIVAGQEIKIPANGVGGLSPDNENQTTTAASSRRNNIVHEVKSGDALSRLARKYGTDVDTIKLANNIKGSNIYSGQELVIPRDNKNGTFQLEKNALIWPVMGRISSSFGSRTHPISGNRDFHNGLDIAVPNGTTIRAAASGTVTQSNWIKGYGKTVVIKHSNNVETLYGHNSKLLVPAGHKVNVGDPIARAGSTGISTGPHLHFEVQVNNEVVNPIDYLP